MSSRYSLFQETADSIDEVRRSQAPRDQKRFFPGFRPQVIASYRFRQPEDLA